MIGNNMILRVVLNSLPSSTFIHTISLNHFLSYVVVTNLIWIIKFGEKYIYYRNISDGLKTPETGVSVLCPGC